VEPSSDRLRFHRQRRRVDLVHFARTSWSLRCVGWPQQNPELCNDSTSASCWCSLSSRSPVCVCVCVWWPYIDQQLTWQQLVERLSHFYYHRDITQQRENENETILAAERKIREFRAKCWESEVRFHFSALLYPVYTIQPVVKPVWQQVVSCKRDFTTTEWLLLLSTL